MAVLNDWLHPSSSPPGPFDLFVFHSIWNYEEVRKVMAKSAVTITILRDPVKTFESGYSYFGRAPKVINLAEMKLDCRHVTRVYNYNISKHLIYIQQIFLIFIGHQPICQRDAEDFSARKR